MATHLLSFFLCMFLGACQQDPGAFPNPVTTTPDGCKIGGCSGQLCVDASAEDTITTCEWQPAYACYQGATCARQSDGQCGWTETEELQACLREAETLPPEDAIQ